VLQKWGNEAERREGLCGQTEPKTDKVKSVSPELMYFQCKIITPLTCFVRVLVLMSRRSSLPTHVPAFPRRKSLARPFCKSHSIPLWIQH